MVRGFKLGMWVDVFEASGHISIHTRATGLLHTLGANRLLPRLYSPRTFW